MKLAIQPTTCLTTPPTTPAVATTVSFAKLTPRKNTFSNYYFFDWIVNYRNYYGINVLVETEDNFPFANGGYRG